MGFLSAAFALVCHFNRRIPGLQWWAASYAAGFVFCLSLLSRPVLPEALSVALAQASQLTMATLCWYGCQAHMGRPRSAPQWPVAAILGLVAAALYFTLVKPELWMRIVLASSGMTVFFLLSARELLRGGVRARPARALFAATCVAHAAFLLLRPWLLVPADSLAAGAHPAMAVATLFIVESIVVMCAMVFAVLMLVNEFVSLQLRQLAERDPLTGVFNRRAFLELLDRASSLAQRQQLSLPLLVVDLDHFKHVNDTWGHRGGDVALCHFVRMAGSLLRKEDVIGRLGGEEFAIFLPHANQADACCVAERLRARMVDQPAQTEQGLIAITASIGVTLYVSGESPETALHRADAAMYRAKAAGRNRVETLMGAALG